MDAEDKKHDIEITKEEKTYAVNINLASTDLKQIERVCADFYGYAQKLVPNIRGVSRLATKKGLITTRKSPCGEGSNTWDKYRIAVHRRSFGIDVDSSILEKFASFLKGSNVEVSLVIKSN